MSGALSTNDPSSFSNPGRLNPLSIVKFCFKQANNVTIICSGTVTLGLGLLLEVESPILQVFIKCFNHLTCKQNYLEGRKIAFLLLYQLSLPTSVILKQIILRQMHECGRTTKVTQTQTILKGSLVRKLSGQVIFSIWAEFIGPLPDWEPAFLTRETCFSIKSKINN